MVNDLAQKTGLDREPDLHILCFDYYRLGGIGDGRYALWFRGQKMASIGVLRVREDLRCRTGFDDLALGHDADPVGDLADDAEIMGDEQHRHVVLV